MCLQLYHVQRTKDLYETLMVIVCVRLDRQSMCMVIAFHVALKKDSRLMRMVDACALWSAVLSLTNVADAPVQRNTVIESHLMDDVQLKQLHRRLDVPVIMIAPIMNIASHEQECVLLPAKKNHAASMHCVMQPITLPFANVSLATKEIQKFNAVS